MPSLKTHRTLKMSKIIEALCRGEHILKFYHASHLDEIRRQQEDCTATAGSKEILLLQPHFIYQKTAAQIFSTTVMGILHEVYVSQVLFYIK